ncbi:MAG: murein DD-endopeptidase MepM/ murein hydrolase activator NlpD [Polaribacter sp.]|jgi:murein DD-endopeptidase MepM/ murein hydrolase activator NlpD
MKIKILFFLLLPFISFSQTKMKSYGGEFKFNPNNLPCITEASKAEIKIQLQANIAQLEKLGKLNSKQFNFVRPSFIWPVRKAASSDFNNVFAISNYVDHNSNYPNQLQDYNCGNRTYDTDNGYNHPGIDIYSWPFSWYQFQNDLSEVIAAAPGTIIYKNDGEFDMSCNFNSNEWNAIYVRHSDNSIAWYGHLKNGSLNAKNIGDTVNEGEYLGVIGSSGNSTGPHLHFEVYDSTSNLIDPYNGNCNSGTSWWRNQPDYYSPNINAALTHDEPPSFKDCPQIESTNIANKFLPNTNVYLAGYFKDQLSETTANFKLQYPDGRIDSWSKNFTNTYTGSYWYWGTTDLNNLGTYLFEITYQGQNVSTSFEIVTTLTASSDTLENFTIISNPFKEELKITSKNINPKDYRLDIYNQLGQRVFKQENFINRLDLQFLSKGVYFLKIKNKNKRVLQSFKIIKE